MQSRRFFIRYYWQAFIDAFTAGSVILLAGLSQSLVNNVTQEALQQSWQKCQSALSKLGLYSSTAERCAENLRTIKERCSITFPHSAMSTTNILSQEQPSANQFPTFEQLDNDGNDDLVSEGTDYLPLTDDLFHDLDFNEDTFFDPFWFSLQFWNYHQISLSLIPWEHATTTCVSFYTPP